MADEIRVALLIDGENLPADHAGFTIIKASSRGSVIIKRVFGSVGRIGQWEKAPGFRIVHSPIGKNIGDIALSLDALELALTGQVDEFVIATSDRDMALVALRLMELGYRVTGIGEDGKTSEDFRKACREFFPVPSKSTSHEATQNNSAESFEARLKRFMKEEGAKNGGWVPLGALGQARAKAMRISKAEAGISKSTSWLKWFAKYPKQYQVEERGTQSRARLKT